MTTTPTTHETVSDASTARPTLFERPLSSYDYLGQDAEHDHHHFDRLTNEIHVTHAPPTEFHPAHTDETWVRVHGPAQHTEALDEYDWDAVDRGVPEWIAHVDRVRGWTDWPVAFGLRHTPDHVIVELERPVVPGDVERVVCTLRELTTTDSPTREGER